MTCKVTSPKGSVHKFDQSPPNPLNNYGREVPSLNLASRTSMTPFPGMSCRSLSDLNAVIAAERDKFLDSMGCPTLEELEKFSEDKAMVLRVLKTDLLFKAMLDYRLGKSPVSTLSHYNRQRLEISNPLYTSALLCSRDLIYGEPSAEISLDNLKRVSKIFDNVVNKSGLIRESREEQNKFLDSYDFPSLDSIRSYCSSDISNFFEVDRAIHTLSTTRKSSESLFSKLELPIKYSYSTNPYRHFLFEFKNPDHAFQFNARLPDNARGITISDTTVQVENKNWSQPDVVYKELKKLFGPEFVIPEFDDKKAGLPIPKVYTFAGSPLSVFEFRFEHASDQKAFLEVLPSSADVIKSDEKFLRIQEKSSAKENELFHSLFEIYGDQLEISEVSQEKLNPNLFPKNLTAYELGKMSLQDLERLEKIFQAIVNDSVESFKHQFLWSNYKTNAAQQ